MSAFWKSRKCLIIGVDGFLGSHLARRLTFEGATVTGTSLQRRAVSALALLQLEDAITHITGVDVSDYDCLAEVLRQQEIDVVFHLASVATLPNAAASPLRTLEVNVRGVWHLLELLRRHRRGALAILASSDKAYGDHGDALPYQEGKSHLGGLHVYDASKACAEYIARIFLFEYRVPLCVTRCSNIYGPGDLSFSRLIPGTIMRLLLGERPVIYGGQEDAKREYLYVDDAVDGYLRLAEQARRSPPDWPQLDSMSPQQALAHCSYNMGGGIRNVKSVREVIEAITGLLDGRGTSPVTTPLLWPAVLDIRQQLVDSTKLQRATGWQAAIPLVPDGLARTLRWYQDHRHALEALARETFCQFGASEAQETGERH